MSQLSLQLYLNKINAQIEIDGCENLPYSIFIVCQNFWEYVSNGTILVAKKNLIYYNRNDFSSDVLCSNHFLLNSYFSL